MLEGRLVSSWRASWLGPQYKTDRHSGQTFNDTRVSFISEWSLYSEMSAVKDWISSFWKDFYTETEFLLDIMQTIQWHEWWFNEFILELPLRKLKFVSVTCKQIQWQEWWLNEFILELLLRRQNFVSVSRKQILRWMIVDEFLLE